MTEETEQEIAKRIHAISTQIENIKATQINTEQLTAVIRSSNAQVRHIERQKDELSQDEFQQACEMIRDTAEKLDYWESRYKLVLDIIEEWDKDFNDLSDDYYRLSRTDGRTDKDTEYWKQKCMELNNDYIQLNKTLQNSNEKILALSDRCAELENQFQESEQVSKVHSYNFEKVNNECALWKQRYKELSATNGHEGCGYSDQLIDYYRHELNRRAVKLNERAYEYAAVVKNLEKVNAECEAWKQRYQELNKKFDNGAGKFTDAKLKADAIALSYDELSETLHAVEQERDKYKEKYEVTKKLLDAETSAEHTGSDSYNELYKENQQLYASLDEKEDQIDGLFKEAKLLTETKTSLVNELLDLKYLIHKLRLDDETSEDATNADDTDEDES